MIGRHAADGSNFNSRYSVSDSLDIAPRGTDKIQPDWLTDRTIEWLASAPDDKPWFHVLSIETPHAPCGALRNVSTEHYKAFERRKLTSRPNVASKLDSEPGQLMRGYYSHVANIDENVGRIINALAANRQLENTIVVYLSDHGDFVRSHGRGGKSRPEEESSNVPLLVRLPKGLHSSDGRVSDAFISLVDLMPTTLGLCGIEVPDTCQGEDLCDLMLGRSDLGSGPHQLFNLADDPYEMHNLVDDADHAATRARLHDRMVSRATEIGDDVFTRAAATSRPPSPLPSA